MRLLSGLLAGSPSGAPSSAMPAFLDDRWSGSPHPCEGGADVRTEAGHAPVSIRGGDLVGRHHDLLVPSAQVKGAILFAGLAADGETTIREPRPYA